MLGGLCPFPLRLGSNNDTDGVNAEQYSRTGSTLSSCSMAAPLALVTFDTTGPSILSYNGQNGVGAFAGPSIVKIGVGVVHLIWEPAYSDAYETSYPWVGRSALLTAHGASPVLAIATIDPSGEIRVGLHELGVGNVDGTCTLKVF